MVDDNFFEAWADICVSSGWQRDEIKESNWALIQYRARPRDGRVQLSSSGGSDGRTEEAWMLIEEVVPAAYREELLEARAGRKSKKAAFLRSVKGKDHKKSKKNQPTTATNTGLGLGATVMTDSTSPFLRSPVMRTAGDDLFDLRPGETRQLSLSQERLPHSGRPMSSITTTTVAAPSIVAGTIGHPSPVLPPLTPAALDEAPRDHGRTTSFMAELRARARHRNAGYRVGPNSPPMQSAPFDYDTRTLRDPESQLSRDRPRLPPPNGASPALPGSGSSDGWLDVTVRNGSKTGYQREAYTPSAVSSRSAAPSISEPASPVRARPSNPSPPSDDEDDPHRRPITQVSQIASDNDEDQTLRMPPRPGFANDRPISTDTTGSVYGGVDENAASEEGGGPSQVMRASKIPGSAVSASPAGLRAMAGIGHPPARDGSGSSTDQSQRPPLSSSGQVSGKLQTRKLIRS